MRKLRQCGLFILLLLLVLSCTVFMLACTSEDKENTDIAIAKIRIENMPENKMYLGDSLNLDDATILVTTKAGKVSSIPVTLDMISGYNPSQKGKQVVTITYGGCTATFEVEVYDAEVQSISIAKRPPEISVVQGGTLSLVGVQLQVDYQTRSIIIDDINDMVRELENIPFLPVGKHTIHIDYSGFTTSLDIVVKARQVISIEIVKKPKKLQYFIGDTFEPSGLEILRKYDNNTQDVLKYDENASSFVFDYEFARETSSTLVKVTVDGHTVTFSDCKVVAPVVVDFQIHKVPVTKAITLDDGDGNIGNDRVLNEPTPISQIVEGAQIDWSSGEATAIFNDGNRITLSLSHPDVYMFYNSKDDLDGAAIEKDFKFGDLGQQIVFLRYGNSDKYTPLHITVVEKKSLELLLRDTRKEGDRIEDREFIEGSKISLSYLEYNVLYNNGTYKDQWYELKESMLDSSSSLELKMEHLDSIDGLQHIGFIVEGQTNLFKIKVVEKKAISLDVYEPYRNLYATGSVLNYEGGYVYVVYNDKDFERIPLSDENTTLYNSDGAVVQSMSYVGEYTAKVTIDDVVEEFIVEAKDSSEIATSVTFRDLEGAYVCDSIASIPEDEISLNVVVGGASDIISLSEAERFDAGVTDEGQQYLLYRYKGFVFRLNVNVIGRRVTSIEVSKAPSKNIYVIGIDTELDTTGLSITKVFNDGQRGEQNYFDALWSFSGYDLTEQGLQTVIVTYDLGDRKFTASFDIEVADVDVERIEFIEDQPSVENFKIKGFDETNNLIVKEEFNGIFVTYREDLNLTYLFGEEIGTLKFKVIYEGGIELIRELKPSYVSYDKNINPSINNLPTDTFIIAGENDRGEGGREIDGFRLTVRINYAGKETSLNLVVVFRELESIEVYRQPDVLIYADGQSLNRTGGYVKKIYNNGDTEILPMTNGLIAIDGYKEKPFVNVQGINYVDQTVKLIYGGKSASYIVRTYRKLVAEPSIGNSIFSYGDMGDPVVTIRESIAGFVTPETSLEYLVNGSWTNTRPIIPGSYALRINVLENEYYEASVVEGDDFNLIIKKKTIIIKIDPVSKIYKEDEPTLTYSIEDGELVGNDVVEIEISREAGEDVKFVGVGSNRVIGSYAINARLTVGGVNQNEFYELAYEQVGLTINPKTATIGSNGKVIDVEFVPPATYSNGVIQYTGNKINAFGAKYIDAKGITNVIADKDILFYEEINNQLVLVEELDASGKLVPAKPSAVGKYKVMISDNYSFLGNNFMSFEIK